MVAILLPLCLCAQEQEEVAATPKKARNTGGVYTGFSGGMMIHGGYLFADSPDKIFSIPRSSSKSTARRSTRPS